MMREKKMDRRLKASSEKYDTDYRNQFQTTVTPNGVYKAKEAKDS